MIGIVILLCLLALILLWQMLRYRRILQNTGEQLERLYTTGESGLCYRADEGIAAALNNQILRLEDYIQTIRRRAKEEADEQTRFLENIAHQMKNSAASLQVQVDMMETLPAPPPNLSQCQICLNRLDGELNHILHSSQLAAGKIEMQLARCRLDQVAEKRAEQLRSLGMERSVAIQTEVERDVTLLCDDFWVGQALENLLKNAIEHSPWGGIVTLKLARAPGCVQLVVEDDGAGIPEKELPLLFKRFHRGTFRRSGFGLGLNMARDIAWAHHGTLSAENRPEGGARFTLDLPIMEGKDYYSKF